MSMQKIYIKSNGPVKEFEMDVNKFNILIGEQATGKSTIAKSIYFFRVIKTKITDYLLQICDTNMYNGVACTNKRFDLSIKKELKDIFVKLFGHSWDLDPNLTMQYEYTQEHWIQIALFDGDRGGKKLIGVQYSPELLGTLQTLKRKVQALYLEEKGNITSIALGSERRKRNHEWIIEQINQIFMDDKETYYIPAGRSLLTVMANNKATMNNATNLDYITEQFMLMIDSVRNAFSNGLRKAHLYYPQEKRNFDVNNMADMIVSIQKGEYYSNKGRETLKIKENPEHPIEINFASSGQQEILWLVNFLYVLLLKQEKAFVIIEEPEAHIFPTLQKNLIELITLFANLSDGSVFITTHSPYVLTSMNNLYYAGVLKHEHMEKDVEKIVPWNRIIEYGTLEAYKLMNGEQEGYQSLLERDLREIRASMIDEVSREISRLYTSLYEIELDAMEDEE